MAIEFAGLDRIFNKKERVFSFVKENSEFLSPYENEKCGILNSPTSSEKVRFHSTSTGFVLHYFSKILDLSSKSHLSQYKKPVKNVFESFSKKLIKNFVSEHKKKGVTDTGSLPNNYNTPLQILGIFASKDYYKEIGKELKDEGSDKEISEIILKNFVKDINANNGFIDRIGSSKGPSAYLTYWVIESISRYEGGKKHLNSISRKIHQWASDSLSRSVSFKYSGVPQYFDAIEVMYLILIILSLRDKGYLQKNESSSISNIEKLINHALEIVFKKYFNNGCFTKSLPVFADSNNVSVSCPTVEPTSLLLLQHPELLFDYFDELSQIYDWITDSKFRIPKYKTWVWRSEWEHPSTSPTSFMAVSVYSFIVAFHNYLDELLCSKAKEELGVLPYSYSEYIAKDIRYPGDFKTVVKENVVNPIVNFKNKDLAALSIILYGPPGTAKTSVTKKIAQDLKWPLLVINTNTFLKSGIEKIDFEAGRIFTLVSYLKDVVVFFDEVEELVLDRNPTGVTSDQRSRLLTTSMLPRINDLRSINRIVFIFATNYLDHIDAAIVRTGRFDCVQCILPPNRTDRRRMLEKIVEKIEKGTKVEKELLKLLINKGNIEKTYRFCYADMEALVKRIVNRRNESTAMPLESVIEKEINVGLGAVIEEEELIKFKRSKEKFDRPNYKK